MIYTVTENDAGKRLDTFVSEESELSRSAAAKLISSGGITVNGKPSVKKYELRCGDTVDGYTAA